jgi:hypothetical protein
MSNDTSQSTSPRVEESSQPGHAARIERTISNFAAGCRLPRAPHSFEGRTHLEPRGYQADSIAPIAACGGDAIIGDAPREVLPAAPPRGRVHGRGGAPSSQESRALCGRRPVLWPNNCYQFDTSIVRADVRTRTTHNNGGNLVTEHEMVRLAAADVSCDRYHASYRGGK